jgi:hypothetical protein
MKMISIAEKPARFNYGNNPKSEIRNSKSKNRRRRRRFARTTSRPNYAEIAQTGNTEFIGVCDANQETSRAVAEKNACESFTDWRELLDKVDAVSIVTPTETHAEIACAFLEKGVHVLVEKPIARTWRSRFDYRSRRKSGAKIDGRTSRKI